MSNPPTFASKGQNLGFSGPFLLKNSKLGQNSPNQLQIILNSGLQRQKSGDLTPNYENIHPKLQLVETEFDT